MYCHRFLYKNIRGLERRFVNENNSIPVECCFTEPIHDWYQFGSCLGADGDDDDDDDDDGDDGDNDDDDDDADDNNNDLSLYSAD